MKRQYLAFAALAILLGAAVAAQRQAGNGREGGADSSNMQLVGHNDLQGRSAYQPEIKRQGSRWIAYVGHHGGSAINPITGKEEAHGTSIVDVTDPKNPKYLAHIPGQPVGAPMPNMPGMGESGGAQMARVCSGAELPRATRAGSTCCARTATPLVQAMKCGMSPIRPGRAVSTRSSAASPARTRAGGNATPASRISCRDNPAGGCRA